MIYSSHNNRERITGLLGDLKKEGALEVKSLKELLERTHSFLMHNSNNPVDYNIGLSVICHVANQSCDDKLINQLLYDCISQSRVFLYSGMINPNLSANISVSNYDIFSQEFYTLEKSLTILTKDQKQLFDYFQTYKRLVVSAPTSFGKSRIVQEIIIHNNYKNIVIVLPTIALLNETFVKFKENNLIVLAGYSIHNSLGTKDDRFPETNNIFILTPEKTDILLDRHPYLNFDFFTMDEIYKIQDIDERSKIFTNCLYRLSRIPKIHFYLIGPYFSGFSPKFLNKTSSKFESFESEIVQKDDYDVNSIINKEKFVVNGTEVKKLKSNKTNLINIFSALDGQSLIYRGQQKYYAELTAKSLIPHRKREVTSDLVDYISENIAKDWTLVECLKSGIAFHHGALPKYIQTEIIELFNDGELDAIVCTSTIVEGVNTTAKNVIIFDQYKGKEELTGFDVKNIKGRAGRFLSHFIGNIYSLVPLNHEQNKGVIEFSFYDNENLDPEDTVQIDINDLEGENLIRRNKTEEMLEQHNVPLQLIQANKFISIHKQIALIIALRAYPVEDLVFSSNLPTNDQLGTIILLCNDFLFSDIHKEDRNQTIWQLIRLTKFYVYIKPSIKELISDFPSDNIDTKVRNAFSLISTYFEFALPKYLTAFENIFNFVLREKDKNHKEISLSYLITILEFGHSKEHEIALKEAGLPNDIIRKVTELFSDCSSLQQIRLKFSINPFLIKQLTDFEQKIFRRYIG
jgi:helicase